MVSKNIPMGIKFLTPINYRYFDETYVKGKKSLYTWVGCWVNTIMNHNDIRMISPKYEDSCMPVYIRPEWYQMQNNHQVPVPLSIEEEVKSSESACQHSQIMNPP